MKGYVLTSMDKIDFQLSSQLTTTHEATLLDDLLRHVTESRKDISWEIVSFQEIKELLEENSSEVIVALTPYTQPFKKYLSVTFPELTFIDEQSHSKKETVEKFELMMIGTIFFTLVVLSVLAYTF